MAHKKRSSLVFWWGSLSGSPRVPAEKSALAFSSPQLNLFYLYFQRSHSAERPIRDARWPATTMTTATFHLIASGARNCIFLPPRVFVLYKPRQNPSSYTNHKFLAALLISANKLFTRLQTCAPNSWLMARTKSYTRLKQKCVFFSTNNFLTLLIHRFVMLVLVQGRVNTIKAEL